MAMPKRLCSRANSSPNEAIAKMVWKTAKILREHIAYARASRAERKRPPSKTTALSSEVGCASPQ